MDYNGRYDAFDLGRVNTYPLSTRSNKVTLDDIVRLEDLENIANSFKGVDKSYAIQAGRELRIIVDSQKVKDDESLLMSQDIAKAIEEQLTYPGQIRVTVIRETRAVEFAK